MRSMACTACNVQASFPSLSRGPRPWRTTSTGPGGARGISDRGCSRTREGAGRPPHKRVQLTTDLVDDGPRSGSLAYAGWAPSPTSRAPRQRARREGRATHTARAPSFYGPAPQLLAPLSMVSTRPTAGALPFICCPGRAGACGDVPRTIISRRGSSRMAAAVHVRVRPISRRFSRPGTRDWPLGVRFGPRGRVRTCRRRRRARVERAGDGRSRSGARSARMPNRAGHFRIGASEI